MSLIGLLGHPPLEAAVCALELAAAKAAVSTVKRTLAIIFVPFYSDLI